MTIKKLNRMPYAQAHVEIDDDGNMFLFSYVTLAAGVVDNWAFCNGTYSRTTIRHIGAFAKEVGEKYNLPTLCYHDFKRLYADTIIMDLTTGEVRDRD